MSSAPLEIFFSYAHEDEELMNQVRRQLIVYERNGQIIKWHDRMIPPGSDWKGHIDNRLYNAKIIMLFMSPHFIESRYCYDVEGQVALDRYKSGSAVVLPIILRPCPWEATPFGSIQVLPKDGKPISRWDDIDEACLDVAHGVIVVVDKLMSENHLHRSIDTPLSRPLAFSNYCSRCGAIPGIATRCPGYSAHDFVRNTDEVFCSRCGGIPGQPTRCPGYSSHNFVGKTTANVYCNRCGATPGVPSRCPGYSAHNFVHG